MFSLRDAVSFLWETTFPGRSDVKNTFRNISYDPRLRCMFLFFRPFTRMSRVTLAFKINFLPFFFFLIPIFLREKFDLSKVSINYHCAREWI